MSCIKGWGMVDGSFGVEGKGMEAKEPVKERKLSSLSGSVLTLTQSKFFSPAFNAAIFDGPLRIYFAQYQEAEALKIYFKLQDRLKGEKNDVRDQLKENGSHVFVMLYPTADIFSRSFERLAGDRGIARERFGKDLVVGISGTLREDEYGTIMDEVHLGLSANA